MKLKYMRRVKLYESRTIYGQMIINSDLIVLLHVRNT